MNHFVIGIILLCVGVALTTVGGFMAKDGWSKLHPKDNTSKSKGYSVRDNIETKDDYIRRDKIVLNQQITVGGDFITIANSPNSDSTSAFVSLVLSLADFIGDRKSIDESIEVDDYLEWLKKSCNKNYFKDQSILLNATKQQDDQAKLIRAYIADLLHIVVGQKLSLEKIVEHTNMLPDMNSKLDFILDQLSEKDLHYLRKGQLAISARVLDILAEGVVGSGVKTVLKKDNITHQGTAMVVWLLGTQSPSLMLLDLVGDVHSNRISLILNDDASVSLRVYDGGGHIVELRSNSYPPGHRLVIIGIWKGKELSLWVNGEHQGSDTMTEALNYLGPACLMGIDIEGKLSADGVRWTPEGHEVGLNFKKNGIWHGSRYDTAMIWERVLDESDINTLAEDPWVMFR